MSALLLSLLASLSLSPVLALSCQPGWATTGTTGENLGCLKIYPEPGWMLSYSANRRTSPPRQAVPDSWRLQGLYFLVANSNSSNSCSPSVSHKVSHTLWHILSMVGFNSLHCLLKLKDTSIRNKRISNLVFLLTFEIQCFYYNVCAVNSLTWKTTERDGENFLFLAEALSNNKIIMRTA